MKEIDISDLLGVWFHDVKINRISVDYVKREVEFECVIPVGAWNSPNWYGITRGEIKGSLFLTGLFYFVVEPPDANYPYDDSKGIEITSEGSATTKEFTERSRLAASLLALHHRSATTKEFTEKYAAHLSAMPQDLPEEAFLHWFYVSDWNTFIFVAATDVHFRT